MIKDKITAKLSRAYARQLKDAARTFSVSRKWTNSATPDPFSPVTTHMPPVMGLGPCTLVQYKDYVVDGTNILAKDRKMIVLSAFVPDGIYIGDRVVVDGMTYEVVNAPQDAAGATFRCQLRLT